MTIRIVALAGFALLALGACQGKKDELDGGPTKPTETPHNPRPVPTLNVPEPATPTADPTASPTPH